MIPLPLMMLWHSPWMQQARRAPDAHTTMLKPPANYCSKTLIARRIQMNPMYLMVSACLSSSLPSPQYVFASNACGGAGRDRSSWASLRTFVQRRLKHAQTQKARDTGAYHAHATSMWVGSYWYGYCKCGSFFTHAVQVSTCFHENAAKLEVPFELRLVTLLSRTQLWWWTLGAGANWPRCFDSAMKAAMPGFARLCLRSEVI